MKKTLSLLALGLAITIPGHSQFALMPKPNVSARPEVPAPDVPVIAMPLTMPIAISAAQPTLRFKIGMSFAEFVYKVDPAETSGADGSYNRSEATKASQGKRGVINAPINGTNATFLFDKGRLKEIAFPSDANFDSVLQELSKTLGQPSLANLNRAEWDTSTGTTWIVSPRQNGGTFLTVSSTAEAVRLKQN